MHQALPEWSAGLGISRQAFVDPTGCKSSPRACSNILSGDSLSKVQDSARWTMMAGLEGLNYSLGKNATGERVICSSRLSHNSTGQQATSPFPVQSVHLVLDFAVNSFCLEEWWQCRCTTALVGNNCSHLNQRLILLSGRRCLEQNCSLKRTK